MKKHWLISGVVAIGAGYYVFTKYLQWSGKSGNYNVGGQYVSAVCSFTDYLFGRCDNVSVS